MTEGQLREMIKKIIKSEIANITMATLVDNKDQMRSTFNRFSSEPNINNARSIQPFGISSRAPSGTECLVVPIAGQASHINIVGHFDKNRPSVVDGEVKIYGADGQVIYLKSGGTIHQGSASANEPVVLGNVLKEAIASILDHLTTDPWGYDVFALPVFIDPMLQTHLTEDKAKYVETPTTNIVGQKNFVERGG